MAVDISSLHILRFPAKALRARSEPVREVSDEVRAVADRMIALMFEAEGIGLAAPQVGLPWRLFVAHVPANQERSPTADPPTATPAPTVYINPEIVELSRDLEGEEEGCLSLPDIRGEVRRPSQAVIRALNRSGEAFTARAGGLLARCWQHEVDHLDGVLIIDRMTEKARLRNRAAVRDLLEGTPRL